MGVGQVAINKRLLATQLQEHCQVENLFNNLKINIQWLVSSHLLSSNFQHLTVPKKEFIYLTGSAETLFVVSSILSACSKPTWRRNPEWFLLQRGNCQNYPTIYSHTHYIWLYIFWYYEMSLLSFLLNRECRRKGKYL